MSKNDDNTENLRDFSYHENYCKLTAIDLSRQRNKIIPQQINFEGKLKKMMVRQCFLSQKSSKKLF